MTTDADDVAPTRGLGIVLGVVVTAGRGSLPSALVHGESLATRAANALREAGVSVVDASVSWPDIRETGGPFVLHDALCPLTPADFLGSCARRAVEDGVVVVGVRPVTDTVKYVADGLVGATLDRSGLVQVVSPIVLPAAVVAQLTAQTATPDPSSFAGLAADLRRRFEVRLAAAPPRALRISSPDDLRVLEALTGGRG